LANVPIVPVHIVRGGDESLLRDAVRDLVDTLVGDGDRSLMVEELLVDGTTDEDRAPQLAALVDAAQTPAFLTDRRVVVGRNISAATVDELSPLVEAIGDPLPSTALVLTWEKSAALPKRLQEAVKSVNGVIVDASPGRTAKSVTAWVAEHIGASHLRLDANAKGLLAERIGEDLARLSGILETLESTFGPGAKLTADDIEPYLGGSGSVPPWELTDAIDGGDIALALERLQRQMEGGQRHGLVILATLHNHYSRMLALDGTDARDEKDAAALLGITGSTFPARKALAQSRRLGSARLQQAFGLMARADRDLKGERTYAPEISDRLVLEVLVARLAHLSAVAR
jgi:DNA polymerase-3 subunit delta